MSAATRYHAALLLRWAASLVAGEAQLGVCARPLEDAGFDVADMEAWARTYARAVLAMIERASPQAETVAVEDEVPV